MKKITDYNFAPSWRTNELNIKANENYLVLENLGGLKKGDLVRFVGYDDVDNHFGIFVFVDLDGSVLEVSGDFSGANGTYMETLRLALSKA